MATTMYDVIMALSGDMAKEARKLSKQVYGDLLDDHEYSTHLKSKDNDALLYHGQDELEKQRGHYTYIPLNAERFLPLVTFARYAAARLLDKPDAEVNFIDVGSGIGEKPMWAQEYCGYTHVTGIEYNEWTHRIAVEKIGQRPNTTLIHGDAFTFDFSPYDVVYMYCPISRSDVMAKLWWHIFQSVKPGAIIVDPLTPYMRPALQAHPEIIANDKHREEAIKGWRHNMYIADGVMRYRLSDGTLELLNDTGREVPLERRLQ